MEWRRLLPRFFDQLRRLLVRYNTIQYNTTQYNTMQHNTIQYNIFKKTF